MNYFKYIFYKNKLKKLGVIKILIYLPLNFLLIKTSVMKKQWLLITGMVLAVTAGSIEVNAQDESSGTSFDIGADIYTSYIWRGSKLGTGPALQPSVSITTGGFTAGVWGSFDAAGYMEADPYLSYAFPFGLSLGLTDYYLPNLPLFEVSDTAGSHAFEINAGFSKGGFSLSANYIINEAAGVGSAGGDLYFQAGYDFKAVSIFIGAGDGWHTSDGEFNLCNIGIGTSKEIKITDNFSLPVSGQVICNPEKEALYVVVGFSL